MAPPTFRTPSFGPRHDEGRRPRRGLVLAVFVLALPPAVVALLAVLGLGAARGGAPLEVIAGAIALAVLPALGLSGLLRNRPLAMVGALLAWSLLVLVGIPLYFPGERAEAIARGASFVGSGTVAEPSERSLRFGRAVDRVFGGELPPPAETAALEAPPAAPAVPVAPEPAPAVLPELEVATVEYHGEGSSLRIPVVFEGPEGEVAVPWMIFDTGATFTTLDSATLGKLGIPIPVDAPEVTLHAATGAHVARLVLVDRVQIGGRPVDGVTVAVCDSCPSGEASGLLGLNVSGQFRVTLDPDERRMLLRPLAGAVDRRLDLGAWLTPAATLFERDGRIEAEVRVDNRARRHVDEVVLGIDCPGQHHEVRLVAVPALGRSDRRVPFPEGASCDGAAIRILRGTW